MHLHMLSVRAGLFRLPSHLRGPSPRFCARLHTRCPAASPERLPPPDVHKLAKFAQIAVTDEEVRRFLCLRLRAFAQAQSSRDAATYVLYTAVLCMRQAALWGSQIGEIVQWCASK